MTTTPEGYMADYSGGLTICRNKDCRLVYRPDLKQWPESAQRCPKCGTYLHQEDKEESDGQDIIGSRGIL